MNETLSMLVKITVDDCKRFRYQPWILRDWFVVQKIWKPRFGIRHMLEHAIITADTLPALKACGSYFRCYRCKIPINDYWEKYHNENAIGDKFITCKRDPRCENIGIACRNCGDIDLCKYLFDNLPQKIENKRRTNKAKRTRQRNAERNLTSK